jgi:RNA polymerase sigma-70 factor (TIGR02943 family)
LLSAYRQHESFRGEAKMDTWVFSILRNRIIDLLRKRKFEFNWTPDSEADEAADEQVEALFRANAHWQRHARPHDWGEPEVVFDNQQFWQVFDICMTAMKENIARVFTMREFLGLETAEICEQLAISENNCWTLLHRARSRLRLCLETRWLNAGQE